MASITSKLIVALVDQLTAPARGIQQTVRNLELSASANAAQMNAMRGQMVDAAAAAWALGRALANPVQKAIAFESAMADVAKVSDFSDLGLREFGEDLRRLSTSEIPMAVNELAELAENAAASGIADGDLLEFTRMTAKAALAWGVSGGQAGEDLAKIKEALRLNIDETMLYADAINHLSDRTASTAPDLTEFARRVAAQGEFYGFSKEETLAFGAAMVSAGAEVNVSATSFRNMGRALTKGRNATKSMSAAYKTLGLDSAKVAANMQKDAVGTTMEVIKRLGQLPAEMQASVMGELFGDEARALAPLLGNLELLERTLGYVADETDYAGSVNEEFARRAKTTEFAVQRLKNQIDGVAIAIGNALLPAINGVADAVGPVLIAMADFAAAHPQIVQAIVAIVGGLVALRVASIAARWAFLFLKGGLLDLAVVGARGVAAFLGLINPLNLVKNAVMVLRGALLLSGIGTALAVVAMAGLWIYNNWEGLVSFFQGFGDGFMAAIAPIMPAVEPIIHAGGEMLAWIMALLGPVEASNAEWRSWGETVGTVVGGAITSVVTGVQNAIEWLGSLSAAIGDWLASITSGGGEVDTEYFSGMGKKVAEAIASGAAAIGAMLADLVKAAIPGIVELLKVGFTIFIQEMPGIVTWLWDVYSNGVKAVASFTLGLVAELLTWLWGVYTNGFWAVANLSLGAVAGLLSWLWEVGVGGLQLGINAALGAVPAILDWLYQLGDRWMEIFLALPDLELPPMIQWVKDIIGTVASFGINIEWPQPPDWLTWLINQGASFLGFGGDNAGVDGARAAGGSVMGGKTYLVGEHGPELITPGGSGWVHTAAETRGLLGSQGGGGPLKIDVGGIHITGVTDPQRAAELAMQMLEEKLGEYLGGIQADIEYAG